MVFRWYPLKRNIYWKEVKWETLGDYKWWVRRLQEEWWIIEAIVCDGKKWLLQWFSWIPVQMCQFHQRQIITRYITKRPKLEANKELKEIASMIGKLRKDTMIVRLDSWYQENEKFLKEKNDNWKAVHERTVKAYKSLKRNMDYLYVYKDYEWIIDIPNTTNSLDWTFSHLKQKVWLHRWTTKQRKLKLIDDYLSSH